MRANCISTLQLADDPWQRIGDAVTGWWTNYSIWHDREAAMAMVMTLQARRKEG